MNSFYCKYLISSFCKDPNKLKKSDLISLLDYMISSLLKIGFEFRYISLLGIDYEHLSSLSIKDLRFLFNYCKGQYLYRFLGFVTK